MQLLGLTVLIIVVFSDCDSSTWNNKPSDYGFTADCGNTKIVDGASCTITSREVGYFNGAVKCSGSTWKILHANKSYIPNPSFEVALGCPQGYSQKGDWEKTLKDWYQATDPTTDHWTFDPKCPKATPNGGRVGPTQAADGQGYIGMIIQTGWMEYAGACLTTPIAKGEEYTLGMSVAADKIAGAIVGDVVIMCAEKCKDGKVYYNTSTSLEHTLTNLTRKPVNIPDNQWKAIEMKFVATADCEGIVIGGSENIIKQNKGQYMFVDGLNFATRKEFEEAQGKSKTCGNPGDEQIFQPNMKADSTCEKCDLSDCFEVFSEPCPVVEPVCPQKTCPTINKCPLGSSLGVPAIHCEANETCCGKCDCCVSDDDPFTCVKPVKNCWDDVVDGAHKKCDGGVLSGKVEDVQACKEVCVKSTDCQGVYFNSKTLACYTSSLCNTISQSTDFTVYRLDRDCLDCETALADNENKTERIEALESEIATLRKLAKNRRM